MRPLAPFYPRGTQSKPKNQKIGEKSQPLGGRARGGGGGAPIKIPLISLEPELTLVSSFPLQERVTPALFKNAM
jgi:hypothetical protein